MPATLQISPDKLLDAVVRMPQGEFDRFVREARLRRKNENGDKAVSPAEADILHKINALFPPEKRKKYDELYARFKEDEINEQERSELINLVEEFENLNVERLKLIQKIAKGRGKTIAEIIDLFQLRPKQDA